MTANLAGVRVWLSTDTPATRAQARAVKAFRTLSKVVQSRIAMTGLILIALIAVTSLISPWLPIKDPLLQNLAQRLQSPSAEHWLGTDTLGRDILARMIVGARPTLLIVLLVLATSVPLGLFLGVLSGFFGGSVDRIVMRIADVFMAFPRLILAILVAAVLGAGMSTAIIAVAVTGWPTYARIARAEAVTYRNAEFVQAARAIGASPFRLLFRHVLPLCLPSSIVRAAVDAPGIILITAGLGFLGLGLPPPAPEWGAMVADGRNVIFEQWWVATLPGLLIFALSLGFNLLGDGLRDALDPGRS